MAVPDSIDLTVAAALVHNGATALAPFGTTKVGRTGPSRLKRCSANTVPTLCWTMSAACSVRPGFRLTARGGRFSAPGTPRGRFASIDRQTADERGVSVTGIEAAQLSERDRARYVDQALREAAAGVIAPVIGQTFPLDQAGPRMPARSSAYILGRSSFSASTNPTATHTNSLHSHAMWRDLRPVRIPIPMRDANAAGRGSRISKQFTHLTAAWKKTISELRPLGICSARPRCRRRCMCPRSDWLLSLAA